MLSDYEREKFSSIATELSADKEFVRIVSNSHTNPNLTRLVAILLVSYFVGFGLLIFGVAANNAVIGLAGFVSLLAGSLVSRHLFQQGVDAGRRD